MASPSYVNVGATASSASATTLTPALNATRTNNNILLSFIIVNGGGKSPTTATAGWTVGDSNNTGSSSAAWAWRIVDGTETAAVWTWAGAAACTGFVAQYTGNLTVAPIDATGKNTGSSPLIIYNGVTTTTANDCIIMYGSTVGANNQMNTAPTNLTLRVTANGGGAGNGRLYDGLIFDPNPTQGGSNVIQSATTGLLASSNWNSFTIALKGSGASSGSWVRSTQAVLQVLRSVQGSAEIPFVHSPDPQEFILVSHIRAPDCFAWNPFTPVISTPTIDWFFPLSEPARIAPLIDTVPVLPIFIPAVVDQGITWFMPFSEPLRPPSIAEYAGQPVLVKLAYDVSIIINATETPDVGNIILQVFNEAVRVRLGYGKPH